MSERGRAEGIGAAVVLVVAAAFIASFALGLRGGSRTPVPDTVPAVTDPEPGTGRIEVLNASGRAGIARAVTQQLRGTGFDVVFFGNAPASLGDSTIVIARTPRDEVARAVARALRIQRVSVDPDTTLFLDATVVLGKDWVEEDDVAESADGETFRQRLGRWLTPGS